MSPKDPSFVEAAFRRPAAGGRRELADPAIAAAIEGQTVRKVIVRAPKLVNIVV